MAGRNMPKTKRGYEAYECISAFQKAVRRSQLNDGLYWAWELVRSNYGNWFWKRVRIIASEDFGMAAPPGFVADIKALNDNWKADQKNDPNGSMLYVGHAVFLLCTARKSRAVDWACWSHNSDYVPRLEIPDEALDKHTSRGRRMGRGRHHFLDEATL